MVGNFEKITPFKVYPFVSPLILLRSRIIEAEVISKCKTRQEKVDSEMS